MGQESNTVSVSIFGSEYKIKGADPEYIQSVAAYVDGKMRELERRLATGTPTKIAILASLNIADELFRERTERDRQETDATGRTQALARALEAVLDDE
ncbi:MAG: cell division protein ZapA [Hyphomicrobiales bacterium]